jgi:hypothetical protein
MLSDSEQRVLGTFRQYLMTPNRMLCFSGPDLQKNRAALKSLTEKALLSEAAFRGGYSLTRAGFEIMNKCP